MYIEPSKNLASGCAYMVFWVGGLEVWENR